MSGKVQTDRDTRDSVTQNLSVKYRLLKKIRNSALKQSFERGTSAAQHRASDIWERAGRGGRGGLWALRGPWAVRRRKIVVEAIRAAQQLISKRPCALPYPQLQVPCFDAYLGDLPPRGTRLRVAETVVSDRKAAPHIVEACRGEHA